jgi:hypothetical protein
MANDSIFGYSAVALTCIELFGIRRAIGIAEDRD